MKQIIKHTHLQENADGTYTETLVEEFEMELPSPEEIIAEKEKQLLEMYEEIQKLKEQNS